MYQINVAKALGYSYDSCNCSYLNKLLSLWLMNYHWLSQVPL